MQQLVVPFVRRITKHQALVAGTEVHLLTLLCVHCIGNISILFLHILYHVAIVAVESDLLAGEANLLADFARDLLVEYLEVGILLLAWQGHFTE